MTWHIPGKILIWPKIVTPVTSAHHSPSTNLLWVWHITAACDKIAHTVSPNHLGQIQLPQASMPLMTPFHHSQFHCPILVEVGRILWHTFSNVSKIMTPHHFKCKKATEWNMTPKQKLSHMTQHIPGETFIWPQIVTYVTSAHNWPSTNFFPLWLNITKLLIQHSLMSWTKFQYHAHQWHLAPHFMTHIAIVKYKWK